MRTDPRVRQTLNQISENLESVNETAQASLFIFIQNYLGPCVSSVGSCIESCTGPCFPNRDERLRRNRGRRRGRAEYGFDFYDDWDDDDGARDALLGWDNDELNRLLVGSGDPPAGERVMSYGAQDGNLPAQRRPKLGPSDGRADATLPHASALWTFVERLPWKIGGKGLKYKPSAADLQPRPGVHRSEEVEEEPLLAESADGNAKARTNGTRARSDTTGSGGTTDSLSSRGDLFPSEDEDDAVPLDDEFAMVLERRAARSTTDENSSRKTRGKRSTGSHSSARTASSKATRTSSHQSQPSSDLVEPSTRHVDVGLTHAPSLADLDKEEDRLRREEEVELERRREAAKHLALQRGLTAEDSADATTPPPGLDEVDVDEGAPAALESNRRRRLPHPSDSRLVSVPERSPQSPSSPPPTSSTPPPLSSSPQSPSSSPPPPSSSPPPPSSSLPPLSSSPPPSVVPPPDDDTLS